MDILMSWLERNGEEYRQSKRKTPMVEQLCEEMATNGIYDLSIASIRSQLCRLKSGVQMKAQGGNCSSLDVNRHYDRLLHLLFDDNERAQMRERAAAEPEMEPGAPPVVTKAESQTKKRKTEVTSLFSSTSSQSIDPILDTTEIRRRFELLSARQELQQRGVDSETIDSFLPLDK
ncbi:hypothetical protein V7S43_008370 [Phytophthora oleae]|uniref:Uncharacterized protein n=1 Tax=Phytophthora oleae TaxID=2107226 RepID=A0ABD3FJ05_9STRA